MKYIFREALQPDKWHVHRADEGESPDSIGQHVIRKLWEADLVVADLTGHNPNVFYELAIAHGWRKPVVHLIAEGESVPFDIVDQRTIFYDITDLASVEKAVGLLRKYAEYAIDHADELVNPLSSFERFSHIRTDEADGGVAVAQVLEEVVTRLSRLEHRITGSSRRRVHDPEDALNDRVRASIEEYANLLLLELQIPGKGPTTEMESRLLKQVGDLMQSVLAPYPDSLRQNIERRAQEIADAQVAENPE
ncbi:hypothetical protein [Paenarthrobacter nicotinovorans]|uniref:hypothetical protein n=1 Tax=Paenarthrobacter nicotinovorans TaxID=29320 RepID=UPI003DA50497